MNTSDAAQRWNWGAFCSALALPIFVFVAMLHSYRSPGDVGMGWYVCVFVALALLCVNGVGLKALWRERWVRRLGLYLSSGIALGVLLLLIHVWQEQKQFDTWSHRGIAYFDPLYCPTVAFLPK